MSFLIINRMDNNFGYYVFVIIAAIVAFLIIKKVTSCMIKVVVALAIAAMLAAIYFVYMK